ncbi:hypothetical protein BC827DRAFT_160207 [Russula dissimulans]|jgi:hypothetical protein|nr:hypothetical protein BC827DRAFT_160207 [Russula dissimulans]
MVVIKFHQRDISLLYRTHHCGFLEVDMARCIDFAVTNAAIRPEVGALVTAGSAQVSVRSGHMRRLHCADERKLMDKSTLVNRGFRYLHAQNEISDHRAVQETLICYDRCVLSVPAYVNVLYMRSCFKAVLHRKAHQPCFILRPGSEEEPKTKESGLGNRCRKALTAILDPTRTSHKCHA